MGRSEGGGTFLHQEGEEDGLQRPRVLTGGNEKYNVAGEMVLEWSRVAMSKK